MNYQVFLCLLFTISFTPSNSLDEQRHGMNLQYVEPSNKHFQNIHHNKYLSLTLDEIDGEWVGTGPSGVISIIDPNNPDSEFPFVCPDDIPDDCLESLPLGVCTIKLSNAANTYSFSYIRWESNLFINFLLF